MMKLRMCKAIIKNVKTILSAETWREIRKDEGGFGIALVLGLLFAALSDILRMIFIPGYPNGSAE